MTDDGGQRAEDRQLNSEVGMRKSENRTRAGKSEVGSVVVLKEWNKAVASMRESDPSSSDRAGLPSSLYELRRDKMPRLKIRIRVIKFL